jgi:hypothetical protein
MASSRSDTLRGDYVRLLDGRFEASFSDLEAARAAARDARTAGFVVHVDDTATGWIAVGRRRLTFPSDERDRYAHRFGSIATQHGGAFIQFVEEPPELPVAGEASHEKDA